MKKLILALALALLLPVVALADSSDAPGIAGSSAYDIIYSLVDTGIKKPETKYLDYGFQWTSDMKIIGGAAVYYDIIANDDHEILSASFNMSIGNNGFLNFAATLPYDEADSEAVVDFIKEHLKSKEDGSLTIGDAIWDIYPYEEEGALLKVHHAESENFFSSLIEEE